MTIPQPETTPDLGVLQPEDNYDLKQVRWVLWVTLGLNILVMLVKAFLGFSAGSLSLLADALHSFTDSGSNVLGLTAMAMASPSPDADHPYGHQKFETLGTIGVVSFLCFACYEIVRMAVERLAGGTPPKLTAGTFIGLGLVFAVNVFTAWYEHREGHRLGSEFLIADAAHTQSDIWVTILVATGLTGVWLGVPWLDIALCFPVAALVLKSAWDILQRNVPLLVDEAALDYREVAQVVMQEPGVVDCHDVATRGQRGKRLFIELHITVAPQMSVAEAHTLTERLEERLHREFGSARITTHVEPSTVLKDVNHEYHLDFGHQKS
jgi:cation diffusion facilitator family transporter